MNGRVRSERHEALDDDSNCRIEGIDSWVIPRGGVRGSALGWGCNYCPGIGCWKRNCSVDHLTYVISRGDKVLQRALIRLALV